MELQTIDSKKLFKVFDASKRKRVKKKREGHEDSNSVVTDDSNSACRPIQGRNMSGKASLQDIAPTNRTEDFTARERDSSPSILLEEHKSPRRHSTRPRDGMSLALKAGMVFTSRSNSQEQETKAPTVDNDSTIYAYVEEAIKRDKKKRHGRRHEHRDASPPREHRHRHHRRRDDAPSRDRDRNKAEEFTPVIDQTVLLETFAKLCAKMNENANSPVQRTQSHKSLQCVVSRRDVPNDNERPERLANPEPAVTHEHPHGSDSLACIHSQENCHQSRSPWKVESRHVNCSRYFDKDPKHESKIFYKQSNFAPKDDYGRGPKYSSKIDVNGSRVIASSRTHEDERYGYPPRPADTRTCLYPYRDRRDARDYREYDRRNEEDRRRYVEQKTSRSFDVHRDGDEEERCRRTSRSETKDKRYDKYYQKHDAPERHFPVQERRVRRPLDRLDRNSMASREEEYRERDRFSERERDSGLSVADGESTVSGRTGRSNCLRVVKQEIAEQREAMDKMMKLWKDLMRCFKGISQTQDKDKTEIACESARESAAAQLRLWRECMRRYETVARDVGDTDARLMEEINKQRSEMSEMATMWQECLQRYRDMSNDFNTLKQQLATAESPTRQPAAPAQVCAEGEGIAPVPSYRVPPNYPQLRAEANYPQLRAETNYPQVALAAAGGGWRCGSPLRERASAPPAWWWGAGTAPRCARADSPDGRRTDRDRSRRHNEPRDEPRYKEKSSKPSAARSEHRRRKR